jgi:hypothetical protein
MKPNNMMEQAVWAIPLERLAALMSSKTVRTRISKSIRRMAATAIGVALALLAGTNNVRAQQTYAQFQGNAAASPTVVFGGAPWCSYQVTLTDIEMDVVVGAGNASGQVTCWSIEQPLNNCTTLYYPPNLHTYSATDATVSGDQITITFSPAAENLPLCSLVFNGTRLDNRSIAGTLSWHRIDQLPPLDWSESAPITLQCQTAGLYFCSPAAQQVNRIDSSGVVRPVATGLPWYWPWGLAFDSVGNLYVSNYGDNSISRVSVDGKVGLFVNGLNGPLGLAFDRDGNLYVANGNNGSVSKINRSNSVTSTFATGLSGPTGLAFDSQGNLYVGSGNTISRISPDGVLNTFAIGLNGTQDLAFDANGFLYAANHSDNSISRIAPDGTVNTFAFLSRAPIGLTVDTDGTLFVSNGILLGGLISRIAPDGTVSTFTTAYDPYGLAFAPTSSAPPSAPIASAGQSQVVSANTSCQATVTLDGTGSSNPNNYLLSYTWSNPAFGTAYGPNPSVTLPVGVNVITLTVSDGLGGTSSADVAITVISTSPNVASLDPSGTLANGGDFILAINGCGFASGAIVQWNGTPRPTTFVSDSQLMAAISASDLASTMDLVTVTLTVVNSDGKTSGPVTFPIYSPMVTAAQNLIVGPGQAGIYLTDGNEHGFTGFVNNQDAAPLAVTMAVYNQNPAPRPLPDLGTGYSALLFSGASIADSASVVFDFPADNLGFINPYTPGLTLLYFNGSFWAPVLSSGGLPPTILVDTWEPWYQSQDQGLDGNASGNLTVVFDSTSTPKITDLNNAKYFAVGITPSLNLNFQNFSNGAVGLGSGATGSGGSAGVGNTFWFDNFQVGAPGVLPELIATLDYSDSFTLTPPRTEGLVYDGNNSLAFNVENSYRNPPAAWMPASGIFTFKTPASSTDPTALGAATGDPGAGFGLAEATDIDFNFAYGLRSDYVVQVDAILPSDRLDISSVPAAGDSPLWYIGAYAPGTLSVFFRRDSAVGGWAFPLAPRGVCGIGIYNGTWEIGLYDASGNPLLTGVNDNNWHNFAVEFDQDHNRLRIYVDRVLKATVDLTILALPTIACPADITVTAGPGQTSSPVTFNVSARGNNATDTVVVCNPASGSAFPVGTTTVNCTAMDAFGNQSSCSLQVTVNPAIPTIATLSPATATAGGTDLTLTVNGSNFADGSIVQWSGAARSTTFVSPNQLTATISAADITLAGQNINTALITVQNPDGTISSPQAFTIVNPDVGTVQSQVATGGQTATASSPPSAPDQGGVTASLDNTFGTQPVTVTAATYTSNPGAGTTFNVGSTYVDLKVSGSTANNSMTSYFYYAATVTGTAEANLILLYYTPAGWAPVLSSGGVAPAKDTTDNLAGTTSGGRFTVVFDGTSTPQITQLTGTPFALAIDTTPPTIICPAKINLPCSVNLLVPVTFTVTATDNCDPSPKVVCTPASGSGFPVGATTVNCRATDFSGNTSTCSFTVTRAPLGFSGFLAPIGGADSTGGSFASPLRTFKMGSTVPVKFTASCGSSAVVTGVHTLQVINYSNTTTAGTPIDATPQGAATTGDQFRLSDGQWLFNLDTKATGMSTGIWLLRATLSDGSQHSACIQLK